MQLRNVAIIAHVDHGKTTLIDALLRQSGAVPAHRDLAERAMDSGELERERGITILAKVTSLCHGPARINIVDTPGHADFGGEVERILHMVDGAVLLVDAVEGPMPQTKFVLAKALEMKLAPIVAINKIDRPEQRADAVVNEIFDLFADLGADEHQLDFSVCYGSARSGWMSLTPAPAPDKADVTPLLDLIVEKVKPPECLAGPFRLLAATLEMDPYMGRVLTGRIHSGIIKENQPVQAFSQSGDLVEEGRISKLLAFRGLSRQPVAQAEAGDIVAICGLAKASVSDTITGGGVKEVLPARPIDPPTLSVVFSVNDGPLAGKEGDKVQSRMIRRRLYGEMEGNIALHVSEASSAGGAERSEAFTVAGRGELQLAILIETMRREGFEFCVGRPQIIFRQNDDGQRLEPAEEVIIDVDDAYSGNVVNAMAERRAELRNIGKSGQNRTRLQFLAPTRGLIGYQAQLMSDSRGSAVFNRLFSGYIPYSGSMAGRSGGVLISNCDGLASAYALWNLESRGPMMISPGTKVYRGMIVGEHRRGNDLEVNVVKAKQLSNVRAAGKDEAIKLTPPLAMSLEAALSYIEEDESVEVTPKSIRLRKRLLDPHERKRERRQNQS